jgi:rhomboid protease GluP
MDEQLTIAAPPTAIVGRRFWPVATFAILGVNAVVFLLMLLAGAFRSQEVLLAFGASFGPYLRRGEYWRLVMPMFLHLGWLHILVNSYALYILGPILERVYGYGRYTLLYVASGMGSSLLSMSLSQNIMVGASGAIFGISGVMLVTGYLHRELIPRPWGRAFGKGILLFIVINLLFGALVPHIDNWAHLGGLITGMVLAAFIPPPRHEYLPGSSSETASQAVVLIPVAVVALSMFATVNHYRISQAIDPLLVEGERLRAAHQDGQALERFREAARRAPHDARPHEQIGSLYLEEKSLDRAIQEFDEAVRLDPASARAKLGQGLAYQLKGDLGKAHQAFEQALGKNPDTPEGQELLADLCAEQKLYAEAIQHYQEALRLQPDMAVAHNNLAWLYATSEDPTFRDRRAALEHAQRAVELTNWKDAGYVDTLAESYYANGNYQEAVKVQEKALQLDSKNPELKEHMARYRRAAGA